MIAHRKRHIKTTYNPIRYHWRHSLAEVSKSLLWIKMKRFVVEVVTIACVASLSSASESNAVEDIFKIRRDRVKSVCSKYDDPLKYGYSALHKVLTYLSKIIFKIFYGNPTFSLEFERGLLRSMFPLLPPLVASGRSFWGGGDYGWGLDRSHGWQI